MAKLLSVRVQNPMNPHVTERVGYLRVAHQVLYRWQGDYRLCPAEDFDTLLDQLTAKPPRSFTEFGYPVHSARQIAQFLEGDPETWDLATADNWPTNAAESVSYVIPMGASPLQLTWGHD